MIVNGIDLSKLGDPGYAAKTCLIPTPVRGRVINIDGDYFCYHCAGHDDTPVGVARRVYNETLNELARMSGATKVVVHVTHGSSTKGDRFLWAKTKPYQGQRKHSRRPRNWQFLRQYAEHDPRSVLYYDREADDGIVKAAWDAYRRNESNLCVTASPDKDMRMGPCMHIDVNTFELTMVADPWDAWISMQKGGKPKAWGVPQFAYQLLIGDTADNIPGIGRFNNKLCGEKTAFHLMGYMAHREEVSADGSCTTHYLRGDRAVASVVSMYYDQWGDKFEEMLRERARLLWMYDGRWGEEFIQPYIDKEKANHDRK